MSLNSTILLDTSSMPARMICSGANAPVDSTVRIFSFSLSESTSVDMFAEFHFACSVPLHNLA